MFSALFYVLAICAISLLVYIKFRYRVHHRVRLIVAIIFAQLAITAGIVYAVSYSLVDYALLTDAGKEKLRNTDELLRERYPNVAEWKDSLEQAGILRDTFILANDSTRMHAYYVRANKTTSRTAVIVHGYTDNALYWLPIGYLYGHDLGYNILLPDLRFAGQSGGTHIQMGWFDRLDVMQWIGVAGNIFGKELQIVVHGVSMGGATTMMLSGEDTPNSVKCFVEDCGYSSVWDQFGGELAKMYLPSFPILNCASAICRHRYGWSFDEADCVSQVMKCHKPMLFIHGDKDTYVPFGMLSKVYDAKPQPKEMWIGRDSEHALSYHDHPQEYTPVVAAFVGKYIK